MAPKTNRKTQQPDKVGVAKQYLKDRFPAQPAGLEEFLKGHVLCDTVIVVVVQLFENF